jgi:hypothetical protein
VKDLEDFEVPRKPFKSNKKYKKVKPWAREKKED